MSTAESIQWVHAVQWNRDANRCMELFADIELARKFAEELRPYESPWITTMSVRGEAFVQGFCGDRGNCGCRIGECESKPAGCRMTAEIQSRSQS